MFTLSMSRHFQGGGLEGGFGSNRLCVEFLGLAPLQKKNTHRFQSRGRDKIQIPYSSWAKVGTILIGVHGGYFFQPETNLFA